MENLLDQGSCTTGLATPDLVQDKVVSPLLFFPVLISLGGYYSVAACQTWLAGTEHVTRPCV